VAVKYRTILGQSKQYAVKDLCAFFEVSRSGYYDWLKRQGESDKNEQLASWVRECFQKTKSTYGYRRVVLWIKKYKDSVVNHKAVLRVAEKYNLLAQIRRRKLIRQYSKEINKYPNILDRNFKTPAPNQKWATDITYIPTAKGFVYMAVVIDLHETFVVGHSVTSGMKSNLVTDTIRKAIKEEKVGIGLTLHSDQGTQYTSNMYNALSGEHAFQPSMSRRGNPYDNAVMEIFFGSFEPLKIHHM
jgi:transposase InsO family protein